MKCMQAILANTILGKVVKSQQWLRAAHVRPSDFVIFCWLPYAVPDIVGKSATELMQRINGLDPRFSLKLHVPPEAGALFPALFAYPGQSRKAEAGNRHFLESDVSTYSGEAESDEETELLWDLTWTWESDWPEMQAAVMAGMEPAEDSKNSCEPCAPSDSSSPEAAACSEEAAGCMQEGCGARPTRATASSFTWDDGG